MILLILFAVVGCIALFRLIQRSLIWHRQFNILERLPGPPLKYKILGHLKEAIVSPEGEFSLILINVTKIKYQGKKYTAFNISYIHEEVFRNSYIGLKTCSFKKDASHCCFACTFSARRLLKGENAWALANTFFWFFKLEYESSRWIRLHRQMIFFSFNRSPS